MDDMSSSVDYTTNVMIYQLILMSVWCLLLHAAGGDNGCASRDMGSDSCSFRHTWNLTYASYAYQSQLSICWGCTQWISANRFTETLVVRALRHYYFPSHFIACVNIHTLCRYYSDMYLLCDIMLIMMSYHCRNVILWQEFCSYFPNELIVYKSIYYIHVFF